MSNASHQKYFSRTRDSKRTLWAKYEAQPPHVREWFQNLPCDLWPGDFSPVSPSVMAESERKHLAGLEAVWGPDHPAVIDARAKVSTRRGKVVALGTPDMLDELF